MPSQSHPLARFSGHPTARWRTVAALFIALVAVLAPAAPAQQAHAASYQYWGYYQLTNGAWSFAQAGADQSVPADGSVEGWRWAVDDGSGQRLPRVTPTFAQLCGSTPAEAGMKRVGVLVDFGREVDGDGTTPVPAPLAACAKVAPSATGAQALAAVTTVRTDKGMVCGIGGYPASGCGGEVAAPSEAQKAVDTQIALATPEPIAAVPAPISAVQPESSGFSVGLWIGIFAVAAVAGFLVASVLRRRRTGA